ncbi:DUF2809 domain-containing protein [Paraclostridium sordellii]|uniref:ribosomal maturation YjgA family protein n=1 Tax=Paraclostridium sordellii TaxID=1505 RepID=UPI0005E20A5F|nr:DUF2809 domain-containing protein [Paeniclostridium sordellii]MDU7966148.1 DUF2809 domain-containing protein [Paeniclostridium sordellii]CEQ23734.1 Protein of uncharacterised function (DUF2809) [[Clostridium] sordellii] [Paeniclostridium sordellii]
MKKRIIYFLITLSVMALGILSRKFMFIFPKLIAPFIGDLLWAMMIYFGLRFLMSKKNISKAFLIAILFSFSIEISQLYQANWINSIRNTILGGLILGHGFLYEDLISYSIGITMGVIFDNYVIKNIIK